MASDIVETVRLALLDLCWEIEKLPASDKQTAVSVMACGLRPEFERALSAARAEGYATAIEDAAKVADTYAPEYDMQIEEHTRGKIGVRIRALHPAAAKEGK